ncbi:ExeA family protein [Jannaschia sp. W003]|uniref:ExeA family protein n=1 Tax=Jannaschia sp. W003 TaxID=2867012 RepID=UPI0021A55269|nr:AAA family ATPase [Jannaschia sp. W003]UWQ23212.1 AAA family ATPase [Jannaschia sp. W003]
MSSSPDIYCSHYGLTERPFLLPPDPAFMFWAKGHQSAFTILEYGLVTRAPITLLTGEVGAGKTTLLHYLLGTIEEEVRVGLVSNAQGNHDQLLRWVLHAFDQPAPADKPYVDLFAQLQTFLLDEYAAGRRVILIFDEAQVLSVSALEELRMYTNINSGKDEILQLILVGQPELRDTVRRPDLTQFAQRVSVSYHLKALSAADVREYIAHRVTTVGGAADLFSAEACNLIHERTRGVPRLINQLCDFALLYGSIEGATWISEDLVQQVLDEGVFFGGGADPAQAPADAKPDDREILRLVDPRVTPEEGRDG